MRCIIFPHARYGIHRGVRTRTTIIVEGSSNCRFENGQPVVTRSIFRDITARRRREVHERAQSIIRTAVWDMKQSSDIDKVVIAFRNGLVLLGIPFDYCAVNVVELTEKRKVVHFFDCSRESEKMEWRTVDVTTDPEAQPIIKMMQEDKPTYRQDLNSVDIDAEQPRIERTYSTSIRSVLDVPFSHGTLAVNSHAAHAFSDENIAAIQLLATVLSEGFQRQEDLISVTESETHYRTLVETPHLGVFMVDWEGHNTYVSPNVQELTGYAPEAFYTTPRLFLSITHPADRARGIELFRQAKEGHLSRDSEFRIRHKNGKYRWFLGSVFPLTSHSGQEDGLQFVMQDITARKHAEQELEKINRSLEQQVQERTAALHQSEQRAHLLKEVVVETSAASNSDEAFQAVLDRFCAFMKWPVGHVYKLADDGIDLVSTKLWHLDDATAFRAFVDATERIRFAPGVGLPGRVLSSGKPAWISDITEDANFPRGQMVENIGISGALGFPILIDNRVVAVFEFFSPKSEPPDNDLLYHIEQIVFQLSVIIQRKQAEDTLLKLSNAIEQTADMVMITDRTGIIEYVNPAFKQITGYSREEALNQTPRILKSEKHPLALYKNLWATILSGNVYRSELVNKTKEGKLYHTEKIITPIIDAQGKVTHFVSTDRDVTERKKLEEATSLSLSLQKVRNKIIQMQDERDWKNVIVELNGELQKWIDYFNCGINIINRPGKTRTSYVSARGGKVIFLARDDIPPLLLHAVETGLPIYRRTRAEMEQWKTPTSEKVRSAVDVPILEGTLVVNSTEENAFDERAIGILEQFVPVVNEGVRRLADLTTLTEQEVQLRQAQKMEAVGQLTAGIAHNFNNKLMSVLNSFELLQMKETYDLNAVVRGAAAAESAAAMVEQLMVFSRSEQPPNMQPVQIHEIIHSVMEIGRETFDPQIDLRENVSEKLPSILGDSNQLEQVFLNLILNARDALETGDSASPFIHIDGHPVVLTHEGQSLPPDLEPGAYLRIRVVDNGTGMDEETQLRLFEPFYTTKEVGKGTGLGLATVYGIVKNQQGWIACDSQLGEGTTFSVYLRVTHSASAVSALQSTESPPHGTEMILLVEDDEVVVDGIVPILRSYGYKPLVALDGQAGWELFEARWRDIDLVILDMRMPRLPGHELIKLMRTLHPGVKVIISTGYGGGNIASLGAQALLSKPYRMTEALRTIRDVLDA